jgi:hypothetical protein
MEIAGANIEDESNANSRHLLSPKQQQQQQQKLKLDESHNESSQQLNCNHNTSLNTSDTALEHPPSKRININKDAAATTVCAVNKSSMEMNVDNNSHNEDANMPESNDSSHTTSNSDNKNNSSSAAHNEDLIAPAAANIADDTEDGKREASLQT